MKPIDDGKKQGSKRFAKGFARGMSAPFFVFSSSDIRRSSRFDSSVGRAWSDVGRVLEDVSRSEGDRIGKKTISSRKRNEKISA